MGHYIQYLEMLWKEFLILIRWNTHLKIKLTMKCNLKCPYCVVNIPEGDRASFDELTWEEWLKLIENYPIKVSKVILIGGEPFYYPQIVELVNALTQRKIIVKILTNGTYKRMLLMNKSPFIKLFATYHHGQIGIRYWKNLHKELKKKYRLHVIEVAEQHIPGSEVLPLVCSESEGAYYRRDLIFAPNGQMVFSLLDLYRMKGHFSKINWEYNPNKNYSIFDIKERLRVYFKVHN